MDAFNIICGIVGIVSFFLALWQMYKSAKNKIAETSKLEIELERIRQSKHGVMACAETINMVVQRTKEPDVSVKELANLARIARGQLVVIANELSKEEERLSHWEYGKLFTSVRLSSEPENKEETLEEAITKVPLDRAKH